MFYIYTDGKEVNSGSTNFLESLQQIFAIYYNFNVRYPLTSSLSLEFTQRFFFNLNANISRGTKRNLMSLNKVINLISKLNKLPK